ncbi:hypothetical protein MTO96_009749 [Rhipicephalus appendiculatus]
MSTMRSSGALFQDGRSISTLWDATHAGGGRRGTGPDKTRDWPWPKGTNTARSLAAHTVCAPLFSALSRRAATAADCPGG